MVYLILLAVIKLFAGFNSFFELLLYSSGSGKLSEWVYGIWIVFIVH